MTSKDLLAAATEELDRAGVPSPRVDAEWLLAHSLGISRTDLYGNGAKPISPELEQRFRELVSRRATREPLAYVLGEWGFRRLTLRADARALIPRPETESVVERGLELIAGLEEPLVLDIGVGSGAIALAIADEHLGARVVGTDLSPEALSLAAENRALAGLEDRVDLVEGELFAGRDGPFDLVVSNPPYVAPDDIEILDPEVARFEPREALVARGATEAIAEEALSRMKRGGSLVLETADGKAGEVKALLQKLGYEDVQVGLDLSGRERVVDGRAAR